MLIVQKNIFCQQHTYYKQKSKCYKNQQKSTSYKIQTHKVIVENVHFHRFKSQRILISDSGF